MLKLPTHAGFHDLFLSYKMVAKHINKAQRMASLQYVDFIVFKAYKYKWLKYYNAFYTVHSSVHRYEKKKA